MATVVKFLIICSCLFVQLIYTTGAHEDDDISFEENASSSEPEKKLTNLVPVHRLWGIPDTQVPVGKLFTLQIPKDAFKGDIDHYEVVNSHSDKRREWPKWLSLDKNGLIQGVPFSKDVGVYYLSVKAVAPYGLYNSKDVFSLEVIKPELDAGPTQLFAKNKCARGLDPIMLTILMDVGIDEIEPKTRVTIIENIAGYLGLSPNVFYLHEERAVDEAWSLAGTSFFMAGAGHSNKSSRSEVASISFQIGCGKKMDNEFETITEKVRQEAQDGTLSEVVMQPVVGWHAKNELPIYFRDRRQVEENYEEGEEDEEDYNESITTIATPHPHRHHHGQELVFNRTSTALLPSEVHYQLPSTSLLINYDELISTPVFNPGRPTVVTETSQFITPTKVVEHDISTFTTLTSPNVLHEEKTETDHIQEITVPLMASTNDDNITDTTLDAFTPSIGSTDQGTTDYLTTDNFKLNNVSSGTYTVTMGTTEDLEPRNFKPTIAHRLKKVAVTAGKILRFKIPENTFADIEDGSTSHMILHFETQEGKPIHPNSWIKFDTSAQEIIALPLEEHVSKWEFQVRATDKDGDSVTDTFELQIQQHKGHRAVNFELSAHLSISPSVQTSVDWEIKVVEALVATYGDADANHITVRSVNLSSSPVVFTWTNDSLPRTFCPRQDIDNLLKVIVDDDGDITKQFQDNLGSDILARKVVYQGIGQCESKPEKPLPPIQVPHTNYAPMPRNPIDQVNATAGQLLVFRVPDDTFFDPEDGNTRNLKLTLLNMDRSPIPSNHWLQFDSKNQEFYGVPMESDFRQQEYQLVCEDKEGLTANDGLIVFVSPGPKTVYSVEFQVAIDVAYESFVNDSNLKRKFFEKIKDVFGDSNTNSIVLGKISQGSTMVTWYNRTLRTDTCPAEDIRRLREFLVNDDESMSERFLSLMAPKFPVISVGLAPGGACQGELTVQHKPESTAPPVDDHSQPIGVSEDYVITFVIPAVVILLMLILSGIVACLFYRKRRASKMGIGDEDEKQSFRNKGIPVIFQDELEEKPEPENKCPVIMKEEKPPLPPPEYQRNQQNSSAQELNDDIPYQPPPPFTSSRDSGRNVRPKPTPTYRKPPPYVPP